MKKLDSSKNSGNSTKRVNSSLIQNPNNRSKSKTKNTGLEILKNSLNDKTFNKHLKVEKSNFQESFAHGGHILPTGSKAGSIRDIVENLSDKFLNLIDESLDMLNNRNIVKNGSENFELVEADTVDKMKRENAELKKVNNEKATVYNELLTKHKQNIEHYNHLIDKYRVMEENKDKNINKIANSSDSLKDLELVNQKINDMIAKENTEKENIFRALVLVVKKNNIPLRGDLRNIYNSYNNHDFLHKYKTFDEGRVVYLKEKISNMEAELATKRAEIEILRKKVADQKGWSTSQEAK